MSALLSHRDVALSVRDRIDQVSWGRAGGPPDIDRFGASLISDYALNKIIGSACRHVVSNSRGTHLPELTQALSHPSQIPDNFLRLVDDSVSLGEIKAKRMSFRTKRMLGPARYASEKYPVYSFEDCQFEWDAPGALKMEVVTWPDRTALGFAITLVGATPTTTIVNSIGLDTRHVGMSIVIPGATIDGPRIMPLYTTVVSVGANIVLKEPIDAVPTTGTFFDEQTYLLRHRMIGPVVDRASELALVLLGRIDMANRAAGALKTSMSAFLLEPV